MPSSRLRLSVLSAIEGLKTVTPAFEPYVVPLTVVILVALFAVQSRGTAQVAAFSAAVMLVWFVAIAVAALYHIAVVPEVLLALNPWHALSFLGSHGGIGLVTLGAVFLAVTARRRFMPISAISAAGRSRVRGSSCAACAHAELSGTGRAGAQQSEGDREPVLPALSGLGAVADGLLATAATVIASQAVITGAYSLTRQAIQLGLLPRLEIRHTSQTQVGQIFMPRVNMLLLAGVLLLSRCSVRRVRWPRPTASR